MYSWFNWRNTKSSLLELFLFLKCPIVWLSIAPTLVTVQDRNSAITTCKESTTSGRPEEPIGISDVTETSVVVGRGPAPDFAKWSAAVRIVPFRFEMRRFGSERGVMKSNRVQWVGQRFTHPTGAPRRLR